MERVGRKALLCIVMALLGCSAAPSLASARSKAHRKITTDAGYVSALATANRFLQAWQAEDHESGLLMTSDNAKNKTSPDRLERFFSSDSGAQRAFQIAHGKKLIPGRYTFPVTLFEGKPESAPRTRNSQIVVVQTGKDEWAVDKLP